MNAIIFMAGILMLVFSAGSMTRSGSTSNMVKAAVAVLGFLVMTGSFAF